MPRDVSLASYRKAYAEADEFSREVAAFRSEAAIPALNELRYAGHHLLRSLPDDGGEPDPAQLTRAVAHCERAMYEAADAGIISALDTIDTFRRDYKNVVIADIVPKYFEIVGLARRATDSLKATRQYNRDSELSIPSDEYVETFRRLARACESLEDSREELNKKADRQIADYRRWLLRTAIAVAAMAVSIAAVTVSITMA